jgi:tRNA-specific 2-thiouridylase
LGTHAGIQYFTIGQREGLGIGGQKAPLYVVGLDPAANRVIVGPVEALMRDEFEVAGCNWLVEGTSGAVTVKIRYNHKGCLATVEMLPDNRARVRTREPQRAITPGQAAVFYRDDVVLGGGWIC